MTPPTSLAATTVSARDAQYNYESQPHKAHQRTPTLPLSELRNVNYFTQIKSFKSIFTPRRARKLRQTQRLSQMNLR